MSHTGSTFTCSVQKSGEIIDRQRHTWVVVTLWRTTLPGAFRLGVKTMIGTLRLSTQPHHSLMPHTDVLPPVLDSEIRNLSMWMLCRQGEASLLDRVSYRDCSRRAA